MLTEQFLNEHFTVNSLTEQRRDQVALALRRFEAFADKPVIECDDNDLRDWVTALRTGGMMPSTTGLNLTMVKTFYRWAWERREIDAEALLRIRAVKSPRGDRPLPRPYSRKELALMWTQLEQTFPHTTPLMLTRLRNGTSRPSRLRKHVMRLQLEAIIELALVCGMRRTEIYHLSIDDVHWDNKYIVVHGKRVDQRDKVREVPYAESTRQAIQAWFRMRALLAPEPGSCLWLSATGPDPAASLPWPRMGRILRSFGDWELHRLRHTCATERLRAGMKIEKLMEFLGHASIQQTLQYAKIVGSDVHEAAELTDAQFQRAIRPAA